MHHWIVLSKQLPIPSHSSEGRAPPHCLTGQIASHPGYLAVRQISVGKYAQGIYLKFGRK